MFSIKDTKEKFSSIGDAFSTYMYECHLENRFPSLVYKNLGSAGLFSAVPRLGVKKGTEFIAHALSGFSKTAMDAAFCIAPVCHYMAVRVIHEKSPQAAEKYFPRFLSGESAIAFCVTENEGGGTDAYHPDTTLSYSDNSWRLNGRKWHITNAGHAGLLMVWCRDSETGELLAVLVENTMEGFSVIGEESPGGSKTSPVATIEFNNVIIPEENIIRIRRAELYLTQVLIGERIICGFPCVSLMESAIEKTIHFVKGRKLRDGSYLIEKDGVKQRLADMETQKSLIQAYAENTLEKFIRGEKCFQESSVLKMSSVRALHDVVMGAIHLTASYGLQDQAKLCQTLMDAVAATAGGGTEYAHQQVIFGEMKRSYKNGSDLWMTGEAPWQTASAKQAGGDNFINLVRQKDIA